MAYKTKYILGFENELNEFLEIYFDFLNYTGVASPLFGAEDCLTLRSTTGDENKFEPILGTEYLINIHVGKVSVDGIEWDNDTLQIDSLIAQHDNDIRVTVYREQDYSKSLYQGFIVVEDNSQPFLDPPFTLSVRALDGLGLLKDVDMVDTTGQLYSGILSVEDWIGNILMKTGQTLNLRVYFPFYPAGTSEASPPLQQVFLNAQTWQQGEITTTTDPSVDVFASEAVDAFTALQRICTAFVARIFQEDGVWNFVSLYAYADPAGMFYNESTAVLTAGIYNMIPVAVGNGLNYDVPVGANQIMHPVNDDAILYLKLATKWVKLNYTYDQSVNKICNEGLQLGNVNATYDGSIPSNVQNPGGTGPVTTLVTKGFDAFCFDHLNGGGSPGNPNAYPSSAPTARGYIREVQDVLGYPIDRYLVLEAPANLTYFRSSRILIDQGDILQMSFQWRTRDNIHSSSAVMYETAFVYLYGDDGSHWALRCLADGTISGNPTTWTAVNSNFQTGSGGSPFVTTPEIFDTNQWTSVSVNQNITAGVIPAVKTPVSGSIEILFQFHNNAGGTEYWFKGISIKILPFLQGSYVPLKGDYNFSTSNNNIKQTLSNDVQISDSPKRYFKGALIKANNDLIPPTWHRRGIVESFRFTQLMERIIYNNVVRINQKIEGTVRGLTWVDESLEVRQSGLLNRYYFTDHDTPTKKFIQTSYEIDHTTGYGRRVFVEMLADENDTGFLNPDDAAVGDYKFQYIFQ